MGKILCAVLSVVCFEFSQAMVPEPYQGGCRDTLDVSMSTLVNPGCQGNAGANELVVPNGSMLNFASGGLIGNTIRAASAMNRVKNPLGLTHSGIVFNDNPKRLFDFVNSVVERTTTDGQVWMDTDAGYAILNELSDVYQSEVAATHLGTASVHPFVMESDGSAGEVLRGIMPHVHLHAFSKRIEDYDGNLYFRALNKPVSGDYSEKFVKEFLGKPYESVTNLSELLVSIVHGNKVECPERVFCSELAGYFYKGAGLISDGMNASNMIPEYFGSPAGRHDLLRKVAGKDVPLKVIYDFSEDDLNGSSCFGSIIRTCLGGYIGSKTV